MKIKDHILFYIFVAGLIFLLTINKKYTSSKQKLQLEKLSQINNFKTLFKQKNKSQKKKLQQLKNKITKEAVFDINDCFFSH